MDEEPPPYATSIFLGEPDLTPQHQPKTLFPTQVRASERTSLRIPTVAA